MELNKRLTKEQQKLVDAEQKRYDLARKRAAEKGEKFDPLNDAPTVDGSKSNDPVERAIHNIWFGHEDR